MGEVNPTSNIKKLTRFTHRGRKRGSQQRKAERQELGLDDMKPVLSSKTRQVLLIPIRIGPCHLVSQCYFEGAVSVMKQFLETMLHRVSFLV